MERDPAYIDVARALEYAHVNIGNDQKTETEPTETGSGHTACPAAPLPRLTN